MKIKCLSKLADKMFAKHGWNKTYEGDIVIQYTKPCEKHRYTAVLEIGHNKNHPNVVTCYEEKVNSDGFNNAVGISCDLFLPIFLKMLSIGFLTDNRHKIPWD